MLVRSPCPKMTKVTKIGIPRGSTTDFKCPTDMFVVLLSVSMPEWKVAFSLRELCGSKQMPLVAPKDAPSWLWEDALTSERSILLSLGDSFLSCSVCGDQLLDFVKMCVKLCRGQSSWEGECWGQLLTTHPHSSSPPFIKIWRLFVF